MRRSDRPARITSSGPGLIRTPDRPGNDGSENAGAPIAVRGAIASLGLDWVCRLAKDALSPCKRRRIEPPLL
jgi:hypothetical protein